MLGNAGSEFGWISHWRYFPERVWMDVPEGVWMGTSGCISRWMQWSEGLWMDGPEGVWICSTQDGVPTGCILWNELRWRLKKESGWVTKEVFHTGGIFQTEFGWSVQKESLAGYFLGFPCQAIQGKY